MKHKHHGKKTFRQFFWRRFLILFFGINLIVFAMLMRDFYLCSYPFIEGDPEWDIYEEMLNEDEKLNLSVTIEDTVRQLQSCASSFQDLGSQCGVMLYQPETGEVITNQPTAVASVWQNGEQKIYRLHDLDLIHKLSDSRAYYYQVAVYSIYVKDDRFVPGEVYMRETVYGAPFRKKEGEPLAGEWVNLSPDLPEGWTKICSDFSKETLAAYHNYGNGPDSIAEEKSADGGLHLDSISYLGGDDPHADALMERMRVEIPQLYAQWNHEHIPEMVYWNFQGSLQPVKFNSLRILQDFQSKEIAFRGETWQLYVYRRYDLLTEPRLFFNAMCPYILFVLPLIVLLPPLLLSLLWALVSYMFYSRRYDFRAYRRNLTGALAHDLKTPLAVIYGNAENLRTHAHPENADTYADNIMENVTHMDEMIASVLKLARTEDLTEPLMTQKVDLTALLHAAFLQKEAQMQARGLTLEESGSLTVKGNPEMLRQLAENLAANAVQHANENGIITVSAEKRTLRISNPFSGTLDVKAICEPFRRGDAARGSQSGSGLGLSIVQQIASAHGIRLCIRAKDGIFTAELRKPRFLIKTIRRKDL